MNSVFIQQRKRAVKAPYGSDARNRVSLLSLTDEQKLKLMRSLFVLIVCLGLMLTVRILIFQPQYMIRQVLVVPTSQAIYDDPYLYSDIASSFLSGYYHIKQFTLSSLVSDIQGRYPFIYDVSIQGFANSRLNLSVDFIQPEIVIMSSDGRRQRGVYTDAIVSLYSGNTLGIGRPIVYLPSYLSGVTTLSGLFAVVPRQEFISQMTYLIDQAGSGYRVVYLAGGERVALYDLRGGQRIYFSLTVPLTSQWSIREHIRSRYDRISSVSEIDIGSDVGNRVFVR